MKGIRKKLIAAMLVAGMSLSVTTYGSVLYADRSEQVVTKGVTHINDKLLMSNGWQNVNVLKVDLNDSNVSLAPIEAANGTTRQTILQMVTDSGAVAGVNADYFDMGTSNTPSLGMLIQDGSIRHAYNSNYSTLGIKKNMGTFMLSNEMIPTLDYFGVTIRINSNGNLIGSAGAKNNIPSSVTRPIVIDSTYYKNTNSIISVHKTLYSIVVENGQVTYLSRSGEGVSVPEGGYVILVPESQANEYYSKLSLGTPVEIQESLYLNSGLTEAVSNMKLGIGGSGLIMKDGVAYTGAAHSVTPKANVARTIVATVKGTNELLLITIDKKDKYVGINREGLINLLTRYRVKDAMYFDGGGSTTFVARDAGSFSPTLQNNPTGGAQRKVVNGVGIFTTNPTGPLANLIFNSSTKNTFTGQSVTLYLKGTDANSNPVSVDATKAQYTISGITGNFSGNKFVPTSAGKGTIVAEYNGVVQKIDIHVEEKPSGLYIDPNVVQLSSGGTQKVNVYGLDSKGNKTLLDANNITWTSDNNAIAVTNNTIAAGSANTIGKVTANYKGVTATVGVIVGSTAVPIESFEDNVATWGGNTSTVTGSIFPATEPKYHGKKSLKMTYTFKASNNKQVAYAKFNTPISISADANSLNLWLYGRNQGHAAKVEIVDSNGKTYALKLADAINFNGWKYVSAHLPEDMALPAKVTKFYVYANSVSKDITTAVYLDHVSVTRGFRDNEGSATRADYLADPLYKPSLQSAIGNQYIINVVGPTRTDGVLLNDKSLNNISSKLSNGAKLVLKTSQNNSQLNLPVENYTYNNSYQTGTCGNTKFIMLGTGSGGIRTTDAKGWTNLQASVESATTAQNIIIVTSMNPLTQFSDALEGQAFHKYLRGIKEKTGQNIFVVYAGKLQPEVRIEDGIRYIRTNGINTVTDNYQDGSFVKFKVDGNQLYYTIEKFK